MPHSAHSGDAGSASPATKRHEVLTFLTTSFVLIPGAAVAFVGAFGFAIWIYQIFAGPPGPPA